jgi:acyl dehydratase
MIDWSQNLDVSQVSAGNELPKITIPITLQRLVMEASANYDLSLMHHDKRAAKSVGASDAFANTFFLMGMYERLLREWAGPTMRINRIGNMRMMSFNVVDDVVVFSGKVREIDGNSITIDMQSAVGERITSSAFAVISL